MIKALFLFAGFLTSCKSARTVSDDPSTRSIVLKTTGLPDAAKYPKASEIQVKTCADANSANPPDAAGVLKVQAANVKKNEKCTVSVYSANPETDDEFVGDKGVYFAAKNVSLREDSTGQLVGIANFQATSKKKISNIATCSVDFPVVFVDEVPAAPITGTLACTPAISGIGTFTATTGKKGTFNFKVPITDGLKRSCTLIDVGADSGSKWFQAAFSPAIEVQIKENCQNTPAESTLISYKKPDVDDVDVDIEHIFSK